MKQKNIILDFLISHWLSYMAGLMLLIGSSYVATLFPKVLGNIIDILKTTNFDENIVKKNILYILLISVGIFVLTYGWRNLIMRNARKFECELRHKLFKHFQIMSPEFYNQRKTGDLIAYSINDIGAVRMMLGPAVAMSVNGITLLIVSIYSMISEINPRLTLLCIIPIPFVIFIILKCGSLIQKRFRRVQKIFADISGNVQENIYGIRVIKAYAQEEEEISKFDTLNNKMVNANIKMVRVSSVMVPLIQSCFGISFMLNLIIGGNMVIQGTISLGSFTAFNTYLTMIMAPIVSIGRIVNVIQRGRASYKRLDDIFKSKPEITDRDGCIDKKLEGNIEIKNLSFSYTGAKDELSNIDISLPQGKKLGVIGRTGSGKTTLIEILEKLYKCKDGQVFIDGVDINDCSINAVRQTIVCVPQNNFLFSDSIKNNITFFNDAYSESDIEKAAEDACIKESIDGFSKGFDTVLGEKGVNISGGQKQRISIARAIIKDPPVLVLDDSLSAVDTITEKKIVENLSAIRANKSTIIISHKLSAVQTCDEIIVLDNGKIVERGTHEELLKEGGLYYEIYEQQQK